MKCHQEKPLSVTLQLQASSNFQLEGEEIPMEMGLHWEQKALNDQCLLCHNTADQKDLFQKTQC